MIPPLFPAYIHRTKIQQKVNDNVKQVQETGQSRALFLYGEGGRGKTVLQRNLPDVFLNRVDIKWVDLIDLDDIQFWSLGNIRDYLVDFLSEDNAEYFKNYRHFESSHTSQNNDDYARQLDERFQKAYKAFGDDSNKTIILRFDTVEAIRNFDVFFEIMVCTKMPGEKTKSLKISTKSFGVI